MDAGDAEILREHTVDFISFSYYNSRCIAAPGSEQEEAEGNLFKSAKNPYLSYSDWGWPIDPLGLRITLNQVYDRYQKPLFIVENGLGALDDPDENGCVEDDYRIEYLREHCCRRRRSGTDGVHFLGADRFNQCRERGDEKKVWIYLRGQTGGRQRNPDQIKEEIFLLVSKSHRDERGRIVISFLYVLQRCQGAQSKRFLTPFTLC